MADTSLGVDSGFMLSAYFGTLRVLDVSSNELLRTSDSRLLFEQVATLSELTWFNASDTSIAPADVALVGVMITKTEATSSKERQRA